MREFWVWNFFFQLHCDQLIYIFCLALVFLNNVKRLINKFLQNNSASLGRDKINSIFWEMRISGGTNEDSGAMKQSEKKPPSLPVSGHERTRWRTVYDSPNKPKVPKKSSPICYNFYTLSVFFCKTIISTIESNRITEQNRIYTDFQKRFYSI